MTRARAAVLDVLRQAEAPLSASGVSGRVGTQCDQATVYRALNFLESNGHAESFVLHCSEHGTERYFCASSREHRHWFHCESCHRFVDLGACRIGGLIKELEQELDIAVSRHSLYLSGTCQDCRQTQPLSFDLI